MRRRVRFLTAEHVIALHDELLARWGGLEGRGHRGPAYEGVDAAVQAVKNSYYETLEELAAADAVYIVQGHVFADGNKRTAAAAMLTFLEANGRPVTLSAPRIAGMLIELQGRAEAGEDIGRLVRWVAAALAGTPRRRRRGDLRSGA